MTAVSSANTIRERFRTEVAVPEAISVQYDNMSKAVDSAGAEVDDPTNETWVRFRVAESVSSQVDIGAASKRHRTFGVAIAQILSPWSGGDGSARALAVVIKSAFLMVTVSGVTFRVPDIQFVGRSDNWWLVNVNCPFYYDELS